MREWTVRRAQAEFHFLPRCADGGSVSFCWAFLPIASSFLCPFRLCQSPQFGISASTSAADVPLLVAQHSSTALNVDRAWLSPPHHPPDCAVQWYTSSLAPVSQICRYSPQRSHSVSPLLAGLTSGSTGGLAALHSVRRLRTAETLLLPLPHCTTPTNRTTACYLHPFLPLIR